MRVRIISEHGYSEALFGLGLSHGVTSGESPHDFNIARMERVALKLAGKGGGHDKFLRQIAVWLDITAPLYWWKEFDTYKVGTTAQSESTMHTLLKTPLEEKSFEGTLPDAMLAELRAAWYERDFPRLNATQIYRQLVEEGFIPATASVCAVQRYIKHNDLKSARNLRFRGATGRFEE